MLSPVKDSVYRRGYRLYNRLYGRYRITERRYQNSPLPECNDIHTVGAVILEGWVSA